MSELVSNLFSPALMTIIGSGMGAAARETNNSMQIAGLENRARIAGFEADQMDINAKQQVAAGTQAVAQIAYKAHLEESSLIAKAAASGGAATDPTVLMLRARLKAADAFNEVQTMANATEAARQTELRAKATRMSGEYAKSQEGLVDSTNTMAQIGGIFSGAASLYQKCGPGRYGNGANP